MSQAQTFGEFANAKAHSGRFKDVQDVKQHFGDMQYLGWFQQTLEEYRMHMTDAHPGMTLRELARLIQGPAE